MRGGGEDFVEVDGDAEGDEEEAADAGADPVGGLERGWGDELRPEGGGAGGEEDGVGGCVCREGWEDGGVDCVGGEEGVEVGFCGGVDFGGGGEGCEV